MYSRFLTWQPNPYLTGESEAGDTNLFALTDEATDIRFGLKGYGFKRAGEQNRQVYHFGCYKCFYRKAGDPDFTLFAHVVSEREGSEGANVYKDVFVTSGVLPVAEYEVKVVACELERYLTWGGGLVEGISSGGKFYYSLAARQNVPNRVRVSEQVSVEEFADKGFDPIDLLAGVAFEEIIQAIDLPTVVLVIGIEHFEAIISITESATVSVV